MAQTPAADSTNTPDFFAHHLYLLTKPLSAPEITIDVSDAPEARPWAEQAKKLVETWFPIVSQLLATDHYTPPKTLKLTFKKDISYPAYTSGPEITISASWIQKHPDDFGMVIHEMVHVQQGYPSRRNTPGWLVEGIADYIRWWRYEPEAPRTPINPAKASYRDSYRTTAAFLAYLVGKYDRTLVRQLDQALRSGAYSDEIFHKATGKTLDALWAEFVATIK